MDDRHLEDWRLNPPDYPEMPEEPEVEPCPFCGKEPELTFDWDEWWAQCANKLCWLSESAGYTTVENWNNRHEESED